MSPVRRPRLALLALVVTTSNRSSTQELTPVWLACLDALPAKTDLPATPALLLQALSFRELDRSLLKDVTLLVLDLPPRYPTQSHIRLQQQEAYARLAHSDAMHAQDQPLNAVVTV